jgi:lipopolysaccharide export system protein LptA
MTPQLGLGGGGCRGGLAGLALGRARLSERLRSGLALAAAWLGVALAMAAPPEGPQAMRGLQPGAALQIDADQARFDEARQLTVLSGKVVITQAGFSMSADEVELRQQGAERFSVQATGQGQAARFKLLLCCADDSVEGQAERMTYDSQTRELRLQGQASLRRFQAGRLSEQTSAADMVFNAQSETFSVSGGSQDRLSRTQNGRVRVVIAPREAAASAAQPASGAAARPLSQAP